MPMARFPKFITNWVIERTSTSMQLRSQKHTRCHREVAGRPWMPEVVLQAAFGAGVGVCHAALCFAN